MPRRPATSTGMYSKRARLAVMASVKGPRAKKRSSNKNVTTTTYLTRVPRRFNTGFPKQYSMTHEYAQVVILTSSTGMQKYQFNCLGMFDPDQTGTGHQPLYFDQMTALYNHYVVIKSKIIVKAIPATAATPATIIAMFTNDDTATAVTNVPGVVEQAQGTPSQWIPQGTNNPTLLYGSYDAEETYGPNPLANANLQGTVAANPPEGLFWTICQETANGLDNASIEYIVEITYQVIWTEVKDVAQS